MSRLGLLHTTIRAEEKLLLNAARKRDVEIKAIDVRDLVLNPDEREFAFDVMLERCVSTTKGTYVTYFFERIGIPVVNSSDVAQICQDKFVTSLVLSGRDIQVPRFAMAFTEEQSVDAVCAVGGYPVIIKPAMGSWGRLLAKINDRDSLEALLEHKKVLGTPPHGAFYIQEYIEKAGRDIRAFVIGGKTICAIYRENEHWITNTARGGKTSNYQVEKKLSEICSRVSDAVGGGVLAIDLMESDDGYLVNEVNHTMEFRNSEKPTGVDIAGAIIEYCLQVTRREKSKTVNSGESSPG